MSLNSWFRYNLFKYGIRIHYTFKDFVVDFSKIKISNSSNVIINSLPLCKIGGSLLHLMNKGVHGRRQGVCLGGGGQNVSRT